MCNTEAVRHVDTHYTNSMDMWYAYYADTKNQLLLLQK